MDDGREGNGDANNGRQARNIDSDVMRAVYSQITSLRKEVQELKDDLHHGQERLQERESRHFSLLNNNIRRIALQPARRVPARIAADGEANPQPPEIEIGYATLSHSPRSLHLLWQEYEFGLDGRKAARLFTAAERGKVKAIFHRRKVFWDQISLLVRRGYTAQTAVDKVYENYGPSKSVTWIISSMLHDRRTGEHTIV